MVSYWSLSDRKYLKVSIIIIIISVFKPVIVGDFSLMSEWQQVSSGLQVSSMYLTLG